MNMLANVGKGGQMLISSAFAILFIMSSSMTFSQDISKPEKPSVDNPIGSLYETMDQPDSEVLMPVMTSMLSNEMGYWSHITTQNTGDLPWGESQFYAYPRYWNYIFVDSRNRIFTDAGGLFVWNGAYWKEVTVNGVQLSNVREMIEDKSGNLWVGTNNGLFELSSSLDFITEHHIGNSNMKKNDVNTLLEAEDGSIWVGHRWHEDTGGGVTILHQQVLDSLGGYTNDIIQRENGDIWVAQAPDDQGNGGYIYVYRPSNDSSWALTESNSGLPHSEVDNFSQDSQGNIWMGHHSTPHHPMGGVTKFDGTDWTLFDQDDGLPQAGAWYTYAASDGKVYYTTGDSIMVYENESWSHFTNGNDRFPLRGSTIITEDRDDNLVIGADPGVDATGGGIYIHDGSSWEFISNLTDGGLFSNINFGADVDTAGNLWVSGFYGATMYDGENWTYYNEHDGMGDTYAWKVTATSDGSVWFGTGGDISRYKDGEFITHSEYSNFAETIFEDSQGNVWFGAWNWISTGNDGGIVMYDGSSFTVYDDTDGLIGENVTAFGEGPDGRIYASTFAGVAVFDGSSWSEFEVDGETGVGANELASDADNNLWIDTGGAIKKWDGSSWTTYDNSDGYMGWTTHIEPADDGSIWLAGQQVQVIKNGHVLNMTPPGYNSYSYVITHDDQGQTWVGTYAGGLYKYDMSEALVINSIADYPDDQGKRVTVNTSGFFMDPYRITDENFNPSSWGVEIKNGDTWETLNESSNFSGSSQISVNLPTTMPTDEDLEEHKYALRVGVYKNGESLGYSEVDTAFALDNIAPSAVTGITAERTDQQVQLSWSANPDNDLSNYLVYTVGSDGNLDDEPVATTIQNSVTLADANFEGVTTFAVKAKDANQNQGEASSFAKAVFPVEIPYQVEARWNMIGLPLDVSADKLADLSANIKDGTLYTYNGSYVEATEIEPGKGYWAKFPEAVTVPVEGLPLTTLTLELNEGWNLVSGVGESYSLENIQDPDDILIAGTLKGFDGSYSDDTELSPGSAYWLRASAEGSVTLDLLGSVSSNPKGLNDDKFEILADAQKELNRIEIYAQDKPMQPLYFGNTLPNEVNILSFSLPPVAPGKALDVRYQSSQLAFVEGNKPVIRLRNPEGKKLELSLTLADGYPYRTFQVQEIRHGVVMDEYLVDADKKIKIRNNNAQLLKFSPVGLKDLSADKPSSFELFPSYPNPFNPSTVIRYAIPQTANVALDVYNIAGAKVASLVNETKVAGQYKVNFDASNLSSGVYFVQIQAGAFQKVQKITLIK